jgi:penicillin-binding protein 2
LESGPSDVRRGELQLVSHAVETGALFAPPPQRVAALSPGTLARIRRSLLLTVEDPRGTGREARLDEVRVAGKTGTAESGGGRPDHAWFAGYAPADAPRLAIVVVLEHGGSGGRAAAPIAREFLREAVRRGLLPQMSAEAVGGR